MAMPQFANLKFTTVADILTVSVDGKALGTVITDKDGQILIKPYGRCLPREATNNG